MSISPDEMRNALRREAAAVSGTTDPLAGIDAQVGRIKRRRTTWQASGTVAVIAALAVAVPVLHGGGSDHKTVSGGSVDKAAYAYDPAHPWTYRGDAAVLQRLASYQQAWDAKHPGETITALAGEVYVPFAQDEMVVASQDRWGVIQDGGSGPQVAWDQPLTSGQATLAAALPGAAGPRLLVVTSPQAGLIDYLPQGDPHRTFGPTRIADGFVTAPLNGTQSEDSVRVTSHDLKLVVDTVAAPDPRPVDQPSNVLTWPTRGSVDDATFTAITKAYAPGSKAVRYKVIYGDPEVAIVQAWKVGATKADTVGYLTLTNEIQRNKDLTGSEKMVVLDRPGTPGEKLYVVTQPGAGQVLYAADGTTYKPVAPSESGVTVIDRDSAAIMTQVDKIRVLAADGSVLEDKSVFLSLCGQTSCG